MTDKAYIVANEQQEMSVLEKLESEGYRWFGNEEPTEWVPSRDDVCFGKFPLALISHKNKYVLKNLMQDNFELNILERCEVAFDGRKEEQMSEKYVVSQEFMNELEEWKKRGNTEVYFVGSYYLSMLPDYVKRWWNYPEINNFECNNRLIAIIRWVNGEDVFEVEKPKKWIVRSKLKDDDGDYWYVSNYKGLTDRNFYEKYATKFDTKEEAESWANAHQEVVSVEE
ncbi:hypothetical protein ACX9VS_03030 [Weissella paramesenteroides]